jgi:hypothetical protein
LLQNFFHLLHDQLTPERNCAPIAVGLQRQFEVVQHGQKLLHHAPGGIVAKLHPLPLGALAGIFKLRLQPGQPVKQLIALGLQLIELRAGPAPPGFREPRRLRGQLLQAPSRFQRHCPQLFRDRLPA